MSNRVVITGVGLVSPVGSCVEEFWEAVCEGRSGIGSITRFDATDYASRLAAEVKDFDPLQWLDAKLVRRTDRFVQFALAATQIALGNAGSEITENNGHRVGVLIGSGVGGMETWETQYRILLEKGPSRVSPFLVPMMIAGMASGQVAIETGAKGPNSAVVTACASGAHAIGDATEIIRRGAADVMIAGGAEAAVTPTAIAGFCAARALSTRNDDPPRACRSFDRDRDGFVVGEGATILILEELEHARRRGASIWGEIIGYGMSGDAYHITAPRPDGEGARLAMQAALANARLTPADIHYINAHAPGTVEGDAMEARALADLFGDTVPVSATKPIHGHQLGATGASELVVCLLAMRAGLIPPTLNCDHPDDDFADSIDIVQRQPRAGEVKVAMSNSFGFGGHNVSLIVLAHE